MSKAKKIMESDISTKEKLSIMKKHFYKCNDWAKENETKENGDDVFKQLKEILDFIVILEIKED